METTSVTGPMVVGTYNMSWASDSITDLKDIKYASEYVFLLKNDREKDKPEYNRRSYWISALNKLNSFIEKHNPIAVGLQEMNITDTETQTEFDGIKKILHTQGTVIKGEQTTVNLTNYEVQYNISKTAGTTETAEATETTESTGTLAVIQMLNAVKGKSYKLHSGIVQSKGSKDAVAQNVGISIILDEAITGKVTHKKVIDNPNQPGDVAGGRPVIMLYTENNYLFVNMHGAQDGQKGKNMIEFNEYMVNNNKNFIEAEIKKFIKEKSITPTHFFVMGDFNDRYDGITEIKLDNVTLDYEGDAPKSCCHNWDSSAIEGRRKLLGEKTIGEKTIQYFSGLNPENSGNYTGNFTENAKTNKIEFNAKTEIPDEDVKVENYLYRGDKVFSNLPGTLALYGSTSDAVSTASDHEFVYWTETPEESTKTGGKRHKKAKKTKKNKRLRRNTRKNKKQ